MKNPSVVLLVVGSLILFACGVRGRPQPPLVPADLGRGKPTFKRATEEFAFPNITSPNAPLEASPTATPNSRPAGGQSKKTSGDGN